MNLRFWWHSVSSSFSHAFRAALKTAQRRHRKGESEILIVCSNSRPSGRRHTLHLTTVEGRVSGVCLVCGNTFLVIRPKMRQFD